MKSKERILTVAQFAKEKGVTKPSVIRWIGLGRLKDLIRYENGPWLIPESNLERVKSTRVGRPRLSEVITTRQEAKEKFDTMGRYHGRTYSISYDELDALFEGDSTFREIAQRLKVSHQRVQQIYANYFAPFSSSKITRKEKRREINNNKSREMAAEYGESIEA